MLEPATGLHYAENLAVKGAAGEGTTGAVGAIDRITHEILLSLEERKTLVVWLFDQTASLIPHAKRFATASAGFTTSWACRSRRRTKPS